MSRAFFRFLRTLCAVVLVAATPMTWAHPGHNDLIGTQDAVLRAETQIGRLVEAGKLDKTWKLAASLVSAEKQVEGGATEWVVIFSNAGAPAGKARLFVFLSDTGEYLAANFTGR